LVNTINQLNTIYQGAGVGDSWVVDSASPQERFFSGNEPQHNFPQICILQKSNEEIMSFGDNHGGFITIAEYMLSRVDNNLNLQDKTKKYVFLGDIIDRGPAGLLSVLFLCVLMLKNPKNIFFVRGNHEDENVYSRYGFSNEILALFPDLSQKDVVVSKIDQLFQRLPIVLYALQENSNIFNMYMHGCIDKDDSVEDIKKLLNQCKQNGISARSYFSDTGTNNYYLWGDSWLDQNNLPYGQIAGNRGYDAKSEVTETDIASFSQKMKKAGFQLSTINGAHQHVLSYDQTTIYFLPNQFQFNYVVNNTRVVRHGLCQDAASAQPNEQRDFPGFIGYSVISHGVEEIAVVRMPNKNIATKESLEKFVDIYFEKIKNHLQESDIHSDKDKKEIFDYLFTSFKALYKKDIEEATDSELKKFLLHYARAEKEYKAIVYGKNNSVKRYIPGFDWKDFIDIDSNLNNGHKKSEKLKQNKEMRVFTKPVMRDHGTQKKIHIIKRMLEQKMSLFKGKGSYGIYGGIGLFSLYALSTLYFQ